MDEKKTYKSGGETWIVGGAYKNTLFPLIADGDAICISTEQKPEAPESIAAIEYESGEVTIKRRKDLTKGETKRIIGRVIRSLRVY